MTLLPGQLGKPATELSALLDYMWPKKVQLTPPPRAKPVLKSTS